MGYVKKIIIPLKISWQRVQLTKVNGDKTYGAANPVKVFFIGKKYQLFIPISVEKMRSQKRIGSIKELMQMKK
jgi:hypothetical protein